MMSFFGKLLLSFVVVSSVSGVPDGRHSREANRLEIKPQGPHNKPIGQNLFFTCKANVPNPALVKNLKWYRPDGSPIPEDNRVYTEEQPGDAAIMLFIKGLKESDSGDYVCKGIYANNEQMMANVRVRTFIGITWEDAAVKQYGTIHTDYKIRCVVKARPAAIIDWLKESLILSTGDRYVIESDGLLIKDISEEDAGTYTCRARVLETGSLEERDIKVEVQVPPQWISRPVPVKGIELERVDFECAARGTPHPTYTWVDSEKKDATDKDGWKIEEDTGHLIAYQLKRQDEGTYTCIAENPAGVIESEAYLDVIIRPKVQELYNKTFAVGQAKGQLVCKASGDPLPEIIWRRWSRNEPYILGGQVDDDRIFVENRIERAPDYTEGEQEWVVSTLMINSIQRQDDDLYECQARNEGGQFFKSGHIQVEFGPTFEEQPMNEQWTWDQNPINLTCIATAIPNATITWWVRDREIDREIIDRNLKVVGKGPRSDLIVTPLESKYYGRYTCKAVNPHGEAFHEIELREAREPGPIRQAVTDKVTATTIQFRFVSPADTGGLPIEAYAVEYKEATSGHQWSSGDQTKRRVWPASPSGFYVLENLQPMTTYDFRFGSKNWVGFSEWGAGQQLTMPERGPPERPIINNRRFGSNEFPLQSEGTAGMNEVLNLTSSSEYELAWYLPEDNGEPIDFFEVSYYPALYNDATNTWMRRGDLFRTEVPHPGNVRYVVDNLYSNTFYIIEMRAHNLLGFSKQSSVVIRTARGTGDFVQLPPFQDASIPMALIIGVIIAILLLGFILVDLTCFKINRQGITYMMCRCARRKKSKMDAATRIQSDKRQTDWPTMKDHDSNGRHREKAPLIVDGHKTSTQSQADSVVAVSRNGTKSALLASRGQDPRDRDTAV